MKKFFCLFLSFVYFAFTFGEEDITKDILDNNKCKEGVVYRERNIDDIKYVVLHYTATNSKESTKESYYNHGTSAHYLVDYDDGAVYRNVEDSCTAFHTGLSNFNNNNQESKKNMNECSLGIEIINPGYKEFGLKGLSLLFNNKFGDAFSLTGSSKEWFRFSDSEFKSSAELTAFLQEKYKIRGRFVVTHADIAPGRKYDVGPMYNYEEAFKEYNAGYYPKNHDINLSSFDLDDSKYQDILSLYGYDISGKIVSTINDKNSYDYTSEDVLSSFQYHFSNTDISGELNDKTKKSILNLFIDYYCYKDKYIGDIDEAFVNNANQWFKNTGLSNTFKEYIPINS